MEVPPSEYKAMQEIKCRSLLRVKFWNYSRLFGGFVNVTCEGDKSIARDPKLKRWRFCKAFKPAHGGFWPLLHGSGSILLLFNG